MFRWLKFLFLIVLAASFLGAAETEKVIQASVDKTAVSTGELIRYSLTIEGVFSQPQVKLPEFKDFTIVSQSQSQNYSYAKGGTKFTLKLTYILSAQEPGEFVIEPAVVKDKKSEYQSDSFRIRVEGKPLKEKKKILPYLGNATDL